MKLKNFVVKVKSAKSAERGVGARNRAFRLRSDYRAMADKKVARTKRYRAFRLRSDYRAMADKKVARTVRYGEEDEEEGTEKFAGEDQPG